MDDPVFHYWLHQRLWHMLSFHAGMSKKRAIALSRKYGILSQEQYDYYLTVENLCVACEYAKQVAQSDTDFCKFCPLLNKSKIHNEDLCLGGRYKTWQMYTRQYLMLKLANKLRNKKRNYTHILIPTKNGDIPIEEFVGKIQRGNQTMDSAYGEAETKVAIQCMIEASGIATLKPKPKIKHD